MPRGVPKSGKRQPRAKANEAAAVPRDVPRPTVKQRKNAASLVVPPGLNHAPTTLVLSQGVDGFMSVTMGHSSGRVLASLPMTIMEARQMMMRIAGQHGRTDRLAVVPQQFAAHVAGDAGGIKPTMQQARVASANKKAPKREQVKREPVEEQERMVAPRFGKI